jgi:hypothetical protein
MTIADSVAAAGLKIVMEHRQIEQAALFYELSLEGHIPANHYLDTFIAYVRPMVSAIP